MKKVFRLIICLSLLAVLMTGCTSNTTNESTSGGGDTGEKKVLRVGATMDANGGFNPKMQGYSTMGRYLVYDMIERRTTEGMISWVAEAKFLDDLTYEVKLRDDIYFTNGEQMIGEDIAYSFENTAADFAGPWASYFQAIDFDATVISEDGMTVTFTFKEPKGAFVNMTDFASILDYSEVGSWADDDPRWWDSPIGSGPYTVVENVSGSYTRFAKNENYWNKDSLPQWDEIIMHFYNDQTAMFVAFENNEVDIVFNLGATDTARLTAGMGGDIEYKLISKNSNHAFCMDPEKAEFQDAKVREAIANVLNPAEIGDVAFGEFYEVADSILGPGCQYYKSVGTYDGGVEYAKQCMAESNYPGGFSVYTASTEADSVALEVIQTQLAQIGIDLKVDYLDNAAVITKITEPSTVDVMLMSNYGGNSPADPEFDMQGYFDEGPYYPTRILDPEYNEHFNAASSTTDTNKRAENYAWVQQWLYDNFQAIPLYDPLQSCAWHNSEVADASGLYSIMRVDLHLIKAAS